MTRRSVAIGEVCEVVGGGTPSRHVEAYYGGDIPWVTPKDMKTWEIDSAQIGITTAGLENSATRLVPDGSVLVVVRSGVLKHTVPVAISRRPVAINQDMKAFICSERVDPNYLARFIKASSSTILQWVRATTADNFPVENLKRLSIPLPPLPEQRRIAEILDKADALRAKRRAAIAQLDTLTQSIFIDMFGDPATNPKDTKKERLGDLIKLKSGDFLPAAEMNPHGEFPVFGGNGVNGYHNKFLFEEPQIVIGRVGAYCGCVHASLPRSWITDNALYVSERSDRVSFVYLLYALTYANLNRFASQSGQPLVSGSRIYPVEVFVPALDLQVEFEDRVRAVGSLTKAYSGSMYELDNLFASLQSCAFREGFEQLTRIGSRHPT